MTALHLIDADRTVCLCDQGAPNYLAAVTVDPDGNTTMWVARRDQIDAPDQQLGCACPTCAPHEQLPGVKRQRCSPIPRCGQPTRAGHPCQAYVKRHGDTCAHHRRTP